MEATGAASLFDAGSVTWRVHADPLIPLACLRGILLELLHPVAAHAAAEHSDGHLNPYDTSCRVVEYVGAVTFGSAADALLLGARVRAAHARVRGLTAGGVPYAGDEPQLLAWVHSCLVASFLELTTRGGLSLSAAEQDAYVAEQARAAMLMGLEPDEVPHDRAGLVDYFRAVKPVLECADEARAAVERVLDPTVAAWAGLAPLAYAALPDWARRHYGLPDQIDPAEATDRLRLLRRTKLALPPSQS